MEITVVLTGGAPWGFRIEKPAGEFSTITVAKINVNSKAQEAGIEVGDVICAVNDTPTSGLTQFDVMKAVQRSGDRLVLRLKRACQNQVPAVDSHIDMIKINANWVNSSPDNGHCTTESLNDDTSTSEAEFGSGSMSLMNSKQTGSVANGRSSSGPTADGVLSPHEDFRLTPSVGNEDSIPSFPSALEASSPVLAGTTSHLPTLQIPLIMLLKNSRAQQNAKSVNSKTEVDVSNESKRAEISEQTNPSADIDDSTGSDRKLENNVCGVSKQVELDSSTEKNETGPGEKVGQSLSVSHTVMSAYGTEPRGSDVNSGNVTEYSGRISQYDTAQPNGELMDILTKSKSSLDEKQQREWYKCMYRSLHKSNSNSDCSQATGYVFAGADSDPRLSAAVVTLKPVDGINPNDQKKDEDVTSRPPLRNRSTSSVNSSQPPVSNLQKRKSWQPIQSNSPKASSPLTNSNQNILTSADQVTHHHDKAQQRHSLAVPETAFSSELLRLEVTTSARRPSSACDCPEEKSASLTAELENIEDQSSLIPEWARIVPSQPGSKHLTSGLISPRLPMSSESRTEPPSISHQQQQPRNQPQTPRTEVVKPFGSAVALYPFVAQSKRELSFDRGDTIILLKQIDRNWFEGQCRGATGVFPASYIEVKNVIDGVDLGEEGHATATYNFEADSSVELSFKKGEDIVLLRRVDSNWYEARIGSRRGIVPVNHLLVTREPGNVKMAPVSGIKEVNGYSLSTAVLDTVPNTSEQQPRGHNNPALMTYADAQRQHHSQADVINDDVTKKNRLSLTVNTYGTGIDYDDQPAASSSRNSFDLQRRQSFMSEQPAYWIDHNSNKQWIALETNDDKSSNGTRDESRTQQQLTSSVNGIRREEVDPQGRLLNGGQDQRTSVGRRASEQPRVFSSSMHIVPHNEHHNRRISSPEQPAAVWATTPFGSRETGNVFASEIPVTQSGEPRKGIVKVIGRDANERQAMPAYRAKYNYRSRQPDELDLSVDDIVHVTDICDDGWFWGICQRTRQFGSFPGNFVQPL